MTTVSAVHTDAEAALSTEQNKPQLTRTRQRPHWLKESTQNQPPGPCLHTNLKGSWEEEDSKF